MKFAALFNRRTIALSVAVLAIFMMGVSQAYLDDSIGGFERDRGRAMLSAIKDDIKKHYYDASFRGIDLDSRFKAADEKIKQATSNSQIFRIIAQVLLDFNDSHTFFIPPPRSASIDHGWKMQMIGDKCYVTAVKPGSDAEAKGVKAGDQILAINGNAPTRDNLWKIEYLYHGLDPQVGFRLVLQSLDGKQRQLDVMAKVQPGKRVKDLTGEDGGMDIWDAVREAENDSHYNRHRFIEVGKEKELFIWKMPQFDLSESEVDKMMEKARNHKVMILDLRGNPGGYVLTLQRLVGHFFERDIQICNVKTRKESKPMTAKTRGDKGFKGKLVVLIDNRSGSCSEVFARLIQLEKRGTVIGDVSAGAVMMSKQHSHQAGIDTITYYGASVTHADLVMSDGKSVEHVGVQPDELILPTARDLATRLDPVMVRAAQVAGYEIDPEKAGDLFPIEWRK